MLATMQDADCYFNSWVLLSIDADRFFNTKTNKDFEAPPHNLNPGRVSPGYTTINQKQTKLTFLHHLFTLIPTQSASVY